MSFRARIWIIVVFGTFMGSAAVARAQLAAGPVAADPELQRMADRLADALPDQGTIRVAVVPMADGQPPYTERIFAGLDTAFAAALGRAPSPGRTIQIVDGAAIDRAANELNIAQPLGSPGALQVGAVVYADYVVVGAVTREADRDARLTIDLFDVAHRRRVKSTSADLATPAVADSAAPPATTPRVSPAVTAEPPRAGAPLATPTVAAAPQPFPTPAASSGGRRAVTIAGFSATAAAAVMAYTQDRALAQSRDRLVALPAGADAAWAAEFAHAHEIEHARTMWLAAAIGAGGATMAFAVISAMAGSDRAARALDLPVSHGWFAHVDPMFARVLVAHAF